MRFLANLWCFGLEDIIVSLSSNTRPTSGSQKWGMSIETNETLVPFESNHKIGLWSGLHQWAIISGKKTFDCSACDVQKWHCRVTFLSCMKWSHIWLTLSWTDIFLKSCHFFWNFGGCLWTFFALSNLFQLFFSGQSIIKTHFPVVHLSLYRL